MSKNLKHRGGVGEGCAWGDEKYIFRCHELERYVSDEKLKKMLNHNQIVFFRPFNSIIHAEKVFLMPFFRVIEFCVSLSLILSILKVIFVEFNHCLFLKVTCG